MDARETLVYVAPVVKVTRITTTIDLMLPWGVHTPLLQVPKYTSRVSEVCPVGVNDPTIPWGVPFAVYCSVYETFVTLPRLLKSIFKLWVGLDLRTVTYETPAVLLTVVDPPRTRTFAALADDKGRAESTRRMRQKMMACTFIVLL
jgi:hypothetical protein